MRCRLFLLPLALLLAACSRNDMPIANPRNLIPIPDMREWYPELSFSGRTDLMTD
jgi:hypothetical protein